jgi:hypothetical protein
MSKSGSTTKWISQFLKSGSGTSFFVRRIRPYGRSARIGEPQGNQSAKEAEHRSELRKKFLSKWEQELRIVSAHPRVSNGIGDVAFKNIPDRAKNSLIWEAMELSCFKKTPVQDCFRHALPTD